VLAPNPFLARNQEWPCLMQHTWIKSTLGHGNKMCRDCWISDLEAVAINSTECPGAWQPKASIEEKPTMNTLKLQFALEKETKGAVRYQELDVNGGVAATYHLGSIYIRKASLPVPPPAKLELEVKWS